VSAPSYSPEPGCLDEAYEPDGGPRHLYEGLLEELGRRDLAELRGRVESQVAARGLTFGEGEPVAVDPVPRLIGAAEWERLETGLLQRARALNAFLADAYGPQRIFDAGVVPRACLPMCGMLQVSDPARFARRSSALTSAG